MIRRLALTAALAALLAAPAAAQSIWLDREHRPSVLTEIYFPSFDGADSQFPTWTWFAATRLPVSQTVSFVGELPYVHGDFGTFASGSAIGNPYLGIEIAPDPNGVRFDLGVRPPLMEDDDDIAFITGYFTDVDREEAFFPHTLPVRLGIHYYHGANAGSHVAYDIRLVPALWIDTGDALSENEFFLGYGGMVRYEAENLRVGAGLTGRYNVTNEVGGFSDNSVHQFEIAGDFLKGSVRPGVQIKIPLDSDLSDFVNPAFGLSVMILP